jgi:hypothetical protein
VHFPSVGAQYGSAERSADLSFDIRTRAIGIGAKLWSLSADVTTNNIRPRDASVLGITLKANHSW